MVSIICTPLQTSMSLDMAYKELHIIFLGWFYNLNPLPLLKFIGHPHRILRASVIYRESFRMVIKTLFTPHKKNFAKVKSEVKSEKD